MPSDPETFANPAPAALQRINTRELKMSWGKRMPAVPDIDLGEVDLNAIEADDFVEAHEFTPTLGEVEYSNYVPGPLPRRKRVERPKRMRVTDMYQDEPVEAVVDDDYVDEEIDPVLDMEEPEVIVQPEEAPKERKFGRFVSKWAAKSFDIIGQGVEKVLKKPRLALGAVALAGIVGVGSVVGIAVAQRGDQSEVQTAPTGQVETPVVQVRTAQSLADGLGKILPAARTQADVALQQISQDEVALEKFGDFCDLFARDDLTEQQKLAILDLAVHEDHISQQQA